MCVDNFGGVKKLQGGFLSMENLEILTCPVCGKKFCVWDKDIYQWKFKEEVFCSYTCMREVEKKFLNYEKLFEEEGFEKPKLPETYKEVYSDLIRLRKLTRLVSCINIIKGRYGECREEYPSLQKIYRKSLYSMRKIRCKYVDGVEKLNDKQSGLLSMYIMNFAEVEDVSESLGIDYKEICKTFTEIMEILKSNQSNQKIRNRWNIVKC